MNNLPYPASYWRHGASEYKQGNGPCLLDDACDLKPESVIAVTENTRLFAQELGAPSPTKIIHVNASPTGRTLYTARLVRDTLIVLGYTVTPIEIDPELGEVHNFAWELFQPLIDGGVVSWKGYEFTVDQADTNPDHLSYGDYFSTDATHKINSEVLSGWPIEVARQVTNFEKYQAVTDRIRNRISEVLFDRGLNSGSYHHHDAFVSHDGGAMGFVREATEGREQSLVPGTYLLLGRNERMNSDRIEVKKIMRSAGK